MGGVTLVEVHLLGMPLRLHQETVEHSAEVLREFSHVSEGPDRSHAPSRLISLDQELSGRYAAFTQASNAELDEAMERGDESIDLVFTVPPDAGEAARQMDDLWDEVDRYCEQGEYLLTLKTPPGPLAYRKWFLREFWRQIAGHGPTSWPDYAQ